MSYSDYVVDSIVHFSWYEVDVVRWNNVHFSWYEVDVVRWNNVHFSSIFI